MFYQNLSVIMFPQIQTLFIGLFTFLFTISPPSKDEMAAAYIQNHKDQAILEMYRSGIPASITLAQALHETNYGTSALAIKANNHFGIKCKSYWTGDTYKHKDDDYVNGKLIKSCFRAYPSHLESYKDHSDFLMNSDYYKALFKLDKTDYINWAHGLKRSGYATDPDYAIKLIKKIEKYDLSQYDYWQLAIRQQSN